MASKIKGYIYIASAFENLKPTGCVIDGEVDNDPHIWTKPYTWGICKYPNRNNVNKGDYVFFVLGSQSKLPQMIFAYIRVGEIVTHYQAYHMEILKSKRMTGDKKFEGNVLVDSHGNYNIHDKGVHKKTFRKIRFKYVIADMNHSRSLKRNEIVAKAKDFVGRLNKILHKKGNTPYQIITRGGRIITEEQTNQLLEWLKH